MRMSDWSSDVCSSDLVPSRERQQSRTEHAGGRSPRQTQNSLRSSGGIGHVHLQAGTHGRRQRDLLDVLALRARRPGLHDRIDERIEIGAQVFGWEARLADRSEEHTSELQSLMRISYAVFCLKKK